jgi:hypothetical protein
MTSPTEKAPSNAKNQPYTLLTSQPSSLSSTSSSSSIAQFLKSQRRKKEKVDVSLASQETSITPVDQHYVNYEEWHPEDNKISADTRTPLHEKLGY